MMCGLGRGRRSFLSYELEQSLVRGPEGLRIVAASTNHRICWNQVPPRAIQLG